MSDRLLLDSSGIASLDGVWEFFPGDHCLSALDGLSPDAIDVPGLWEANGHLDLDGVAWYRRPFVLDAADGFWTLRFGAVMDIADVYVNGRFLGSHDSPFTPFELDATDALVAEENVVTVRVFDPSLDDPEHRRLPHGKQGWANQVFPSPPSLYMTYGGIWQPVTLRRHGAVVIRDVFVNGDPDGLTVTVDVENVSGHEQRAHVSVRTLGFAPDVALVVPAREFASARFELGAANAGQWRPESPVLHEARADVVVANAPSDTRTVTYGLRTVRVDGARVLIGDEPYRMKSALVQGFTADRLYDEGTRSAIETEVRAAKALGFNTLRLHIKAFDPSYLDVCDELGMLLECDIPIAEPILHEEMADGTVFSDRCARAAAEQVRRDRNHPSVVLWAAMNELGLEQGESRRWDAYEQFVRTVTGAMREADPTRPIIENEWVEPDPDQVFTTPILTAHWYGRLHADYLEKIDRHSARWADVGRPLFVSEFGDWGLPEMPAVDDPAFWDTREIYVAGLSAARWPGTLEEFVVETHRYQGVSDRLQAEVFRRHDHIGGYCLTELTDVPHEMNGILDIHRRPKTQAAVEVRRMNQTVLPMLVLESLVATAGGEVRAPLYVANDGAAIASAAIEARFGDSAMPAWTTSVDSIAPYRASCLGEVTLPVPHAPGSHDLALVVRSGGHVVAENRYPIHVVAVRDMDPGATLVVPEGGLDEAASDEARARLAAGETVIVLAQDPDAGPRYPVSLHLDAVGTSWGSSVFHFTTDDGALASLPRRSVLVGEDSTIQARSAATAVGEGAWPTTPVVIAYKPAPSQLTGTVVGAQDVGPGRMIFCQYRLADARARGDAAARALYDDLVRWATAPRPLIQSERTTKPDGRALTLYSYAPGPVE